MLSFYHISGFICNRKPAKAVPWRQPLVDLPANGSVSQVNHILLVQLQIQPKEIIRQGFDCCNDPLHNGKFRIVFDQIRDQFFIAPTSFPVCFRDLLTCILNLLISGSPHKPHLFQQRIIPITKQPLQARMDAQFRQLSNLVFS